MKLYPIICVTVLTFGVGIVAKFDNHVICSVNTAGVCRYRITSTNKEITCEAECCKHSTRFCSHDFGFIKASSLRTNARQKRDQNANKTQEPPSKKASSSEKSKPEKWSPPKPPYAIIIIGVVLIMAVFITVIVGVLLVRRKLNNCEDGNCACDIEAESKKPAGASTSEQASPDGQEAYAEPPADEYPQDDVQIDITQELDSSQVETSQVPYELDPTQELEDVGDMSGTQVTGEQGQQEIPAGDKPVEEGLMVGEDNVDMKVWARRASGEPNGVLNQGGNELSGGYIGGTAPNSGL